MKLMVLVFPVIIFLGNRYNEVQFKFTELAGEYMVYKSEIIEANSNGWSYEKRYHRTLKLYSDSTYEEVNLSFESFDYIDEFGKWEPINNGHIGLTPLGKLDFVNGSFERIKSYAKVLQPNKYLEILLNGELKILDEGFLKNEKLTKKD